MWVAVGRCLARFEEFWQLHIQRYLRRLLMERETPLFWLPRSSGLLHDMNGAEKIVG